MASIHRKTKNGNWYVMYWQDGKQKHRSLETRNERKARQLKRELELVLEEQGRVELVVDDRPKSQLRNPSVEQFWEQFSQWAMMHRSRCTVDEYRTWFNQFKEFARLEQLGDATKSDVELFKAKLLRQGKGKPQGVGLDRSSVNNALKTLRSIWNHAKKLDYYSGENPFAEVEPFRLPQRPSRGYLNGEQVKALLDACDRYAREKYVKQLEARNVKLAVALMALAGLRKREVCFAQWEWIGWEKKILSVSNHDGFTTKNRRGRAISMHEDLVGILETWRKDSGYILESLRANEGKTRYRSDFKKSFMRICELAGVEARPHDLRHSFASRHAVRGRSLHVIAGWLGHSTTWVTERYAHFQREYNADVNDM